VMDGQYETGFPPYGRNFKPGESRPRLVKMEEAHRCDRVIQELISHPQIGAWAAALTGAKKVQVVTTQLLWKAPGDAESANVGWHQDRQYWGSIWEGELLTAWIAISDVPANSGPVCFVPGSHCWGLLNAGDFFSGKLDDLKARMRAAHPDGDWNEVQAVLPPGAMSFHHQLTIHGSGPNRSALPRRSFAVHLRTEKSRLIDPNHESAKRIAEEGFVCPVIYRGN
jgi:ectoine hydroxylase-related dioxygenase (phytanoyl-CoA dioxygenase family)